MTGILKFSNPRLSGKCSKNQPSKLSAHRLIARRRLGMLRSFLSDSARRRMSYDLLLFVMLRLVSLVTGEVERRIFWRNLRSEVFNVFDLFCRKQIVVDAVTPCLPAHDGSQIFSFHVEVYFSRDFVASSGYLIYQVPHGSILRVSSASLVCSPVIGSNSPKCFPRWLYFSTFPHSKFHS